MTAKTRRSITFPLDSPIITGSDSDPAVRVIARLGRAQTEQSARRIARAVGLRRPSRHALAAVERPDTDVARSAADVLRAAAPSVLVNHSERTYAFAALLGATGDVKWDPELLYVASMLHDLGLTPAVTGEGPFEQRGAVAAHRWLKGQGWLDDRAEPVARAIRMHLDVGKASRERPEVALLHLGAAADVTGMRLEDLPPQTIHDVVSAYPREGFKAFFTDKVRTEARRHPRSATAALCRWGQFVRRIQRAPFSD